MAWISVDQKLIGGKLRSLYKSLGCSQCEAMGILVLLWLWGIDNADMDGLIISADRSDIEDVLKPGLSPDVDAGNVVESLIQNRWIDEVEGKLYFHDWNEWRSYYNKYIGEKKKHAERMRKYRNKNTCIDSYNESDVTCDDAITEDIVIENSQEPEKKSPKYDKDFETFWSVYPRKADKGQCYKKYKSRIKDGYSPDELLVAATAYADQCRRQRTETQFIKHGKTFLGDSVPFADFLPKMNEQTINESNAVPAGNPFRR